MSSGKETPGEWKLSAKVTPDGTDLICVKGDFKAMSLLVTAADGSKVSNGATSWVEMPATRVNAMMCEALASPTFCSKEYLSLRGELMRPAPFKMQAWAAVEPKLSSKFVAEVQASGGTVPTVAQREFCAFAYGERGFLNASEQGTAKTLMASMLIKAWGLPRTVVLVPTRDLCLQWQSEVYKYFDDPPIVVPFTDGTAVERANVLKELTTSGNQLVVAVNYHVLAALLKSLAEWQPDVVVFDESWTLKNPNAKWTKAAIVLADRAKHVLCLNGTPFGQDISDLWSQFRLVDDKKGVGMGDRDEWIGRYAKTYDLPVGRHVIKKVVPGVAGIKDPVGLVRRIEPKFYRATKASCADLPEKFAPVEVRLLMPPKLSKLYALVDGQGDAVFNPMSLNGDRTTTIRKQQLTSGTCPAIMSTEGRELYEGGVLPSPKRDWCIDWAKGRLLGDPTYRAIIWLKYTLSIHVLEQELADLLGENRVFAVTSATKDPALVAAKASFNARDPDGVQVFVAQTAKFAYGQNLQGCDWNILYDHSWSYLERDQLEDRSHRLGRVGPVGYTELVCEYTSAKGKVCNTVDDDVLRAFRARENFAERFGPDTTGGCED